MLVIASILVAAVLPFGALPVSAQSDGEPDRRIALTFDDLPMTGSGCDGGLVSEVTAKLTGVLESRSLPAAGLATPGRDCVTREMLRETFARWREIGAIIGNHTATHPDLNTTSVRDYLASIDRGQELIDDAVDTEVRWFRAPYLHAGDEPRKKDAVAAHLEAEGYRIAPVTIDNQEWVYAAVYADARARGDEELARRVVDGYIAHLEECMTFYERLSRRVFGREIPQVLLLHANLLNAEHLDRVVDMLADRGYGFIGLPEAVADAAYSRDDTYVGPRGLSWIQRWALADGVTVPPEPREAEWVAEAFEAMQARGSDDAESPIGSSEDRSGSEAASRPDPRREIAAASRAFSEAYVAGDTATIRALYTPDALLLPPERDVRGRDAIGRYFAPGSRRVNVAHAMTSDELRISGGVAIDVGTWSNRWRSDGGPVREASGRYLVVWRRGEDGRWRIEYDMWHRPTG